MTTALDPGATPRTTRRATLSNGTAVARLGRLRGANNEGVLAVLILVLALAVGFVAPSFWSAATAVNLIGSASATMVFALGVLLVLISGGIDVSFMAIGIFAAYSTLKAAQHSGWASGNVVVPFAAAIVIGILLGLVNAAAISKLRIPTLIATLGTQGVIRGMLISFVGSRVISDLPGATAGLSTSYLFVAGGQVKTPLTVLVVPIAALCVLVALMLRNTMFGRSVYALGADVESTRRAGFSVGWTQLRVYVLAGGLAAVGGLIHVVLVREADPFALVGGELDVIAAVVLGGASIFGGKGSVTGTVLGVLLISLIDNSLILLGVPSSWQRAAVGFLLLVGVSVQGLQAKRPRRTAAVEVFA
ncbi:MAG: ABC transporter permease [Cellulomonas sp.]|uniref:ABC transporter permease n=1 Tax=Cellulomonas sp. 73-92 TaxID=1895740 RepID=UPI000B28D8B0|nr:ABC transporter permease [Cellulomonas sp. 73-92]MBN9375776.1 ABC transporter permease [Cellulomonas sp.]